MLELIFGIFVLVVVSWLSLFLFDWLWLIFARLCLLSFWLWGLSQVSWVPVLWVVDQVLFFLLVRGDGDWEFGLHLLTLEDSSMDWSNLKIIVDFSILGVLSWWESLLVVFLLS